MVTRGFYHFLLVWRDDIIKARKLKYFLRYGLGIDNELNMSARYQTTKRIAQQTVRTPFCRWCKDHGKSREQYTSHYPRDLDGNTICPDILSRKCSHCDELGHVASACQFLAEQKRNRRYQEKSSFCDEDGFATVSKRSKGRSKSEKPVVIIATVSGFDGLEEDKPVEMDWQTGFQTPAEAFGTRKPVIATVWADEDGEMDYEETIVW